MSNLLLGITNATLFNTTGVTTSTIGVQYAFIPAIMPYTSILDAVLFLDGCESSNCTATCMDQSVAFRSLETFHNCLVYPLVAHLYASPNISAKDAELAVSLGMDHSEEQTVQNITSTIHACLAGYCDSNPDCETSLSNAMSTFYSERWPSSSILDFPICGYEPPSGLDPDVGGIGVCINNARLPTAALAEG